VITNWDGEEIRLADPWVDQKLFQFGTLEVSNSNVIFAGIGMVIMLVSFSICLGIYCIKNKQTLK